MSQYVQCAAEHSGRKRQPDPREASVSAQLKRDKIKSEWKFTPANLGCGLSVAR
jgi:hypothetical protein